MQINTQPTKPTKEPEPQIEKKEEKGIFSWAWGGIKKVASVLQGEDHPPKVDTVSSNTDIHTKETSLFERTTQSSYLPEHAKMEIPTHSWGKDLFQGFNQHILSQYKEQLNSVLNLLETKEIISQSQKEGYMENPMQFFIDLQNDKSLRNDIEGDDGYIAWCLDHNEPKLVDAWEDLQLARQDYMVELGMNRFQMNHDLQKEKLTEVDNNTLSTNELKEILDNYNQWQDMNVKMSKLEKKINALEAKKFEQGSLSEKGENQLQELKKEWESLGQTRDQLYDKFFEPYTQYCKAMTFQYLQNDPKYIEAFNFISEKKHEFVNNNPNASAEDIINEVNRLFNNDPEFQKQVCYMLDQERNLRQVFKMPQSPQDEMLDKMFTQESLNLESFQNAWKAFTSEAYKGFENDVNRAQQHIKDHPGRMLVSPGILGAGLILGAPVTVPLAAMGGVFAYHVGKRALQPALSYLEKQGVYADIKAAKQDHEVRMPFLEKIYAKNLSHEERLNALLKLHEAKMLLQEDLDMPELQDLLDDFKEKIGAENIQNIPSKKKIAEMRQKWLPALRKPFDDEVKLEGLKEMYKAGILFQSDFELPQIISLGLKQQFCKEAQIEEEQFEESIQNAEKYKAQRNQILFLVRQEANFSIDEKTNQLLELHNKGVLFQQDLQQIIDQVEDGDKIVDKFLNQQNITASNLPDKITHYTKTRISLMREHDDIRKPLLGLLKSDNKEEIIHALQQLYASNVLFSDDIKDLDPALVTEAIKVKDLNSFYSREQFYEQNLATQFEKIGEVTAELLKQGAMAVYNNPANIIYGPLKGLKSSIEIATKALEDTFGTFTDVKTTALSSRASKVLPTDAQLKKAAAFSLNKTIGTVKWSVLGAAIGTSVMGIFGAKLGGIAGGIFGFCKTNGKISQIPKGGFMRAFKFSGKGALLGAAVPVVAGTITAGLGLAGLIAASTVISVATMGLGLIIPCILFGAFMGWQIAGWTGKDTPVDPTDPTMNIYEYTPPENFFANTEAIIKD